MGLVLVGSFLAFRVEALATSAGRPVVRIAHEEAAPRDAFRVVHARAIEVFLAVAVDEDLESVDLDDLVVLVDLPVERETVAEAGAAAARDVHPEIRVFEGAQRLAGLWIGPLDELLDFARSEEHTSELQSLAYLVCRLLLEKKKKNHQIQHAS